MSTSSNLGTILRHYATRQESAFVNLREFSEYIKKYSAKHLEEQPDLVKYLETTESSLLKDAEELAEKHEVYILNKTLGKASVIVITYYSIQFANRYKEIVSNITTPFPIVSDLPKQLPSDAIEKFSADEFIPSAQEKQNTKSPKLYCLLMPRDVPSILFPACVPIQFLIKTAMAKIRHMLKKDEYHDYFQKKLRTSNPGKELSAQNYFKKFISQNETQDLNMDISGDNFYFWNQLCYFIRQDFEKVKDRTSEHTNILQSVAISEIWTNSLKEKASKKQQKELALKELEQDLEKPPFFFSMESILKLKDSKGKLIYGQISEDELKDFLQRLTTECPNNELPRLLVFKIETGARYFIFKERVFQLVIRLSNEAHDTVEKRITEKWFNALSNYQKLPEMKDEKLFENCVKKEVKECSPVLYALLNANFLTMLSFESDHNNDVRIFSNGKLLPYTELLMLKSSSILSNAKMMLPFWYTIPIISWLAKLFNKKNKTIPTPSNKVKEFTSDDIPDDSHSSGKNGSKREILTKTAKEISEYLVPPGSTIDRELDSYLKIWNKMITKEAHDTLTSDVNSLIRDYMRKVIKTISAQTFSLERVQNLAETLVKTPNMQKIKEEEALSMYVQLFILRLISNG